jgi:CRISPR/Cas system-associated protein Csm6
MAREHIRDLVRDQEWQKVRKSLLGQWKEKPEWCCAQLNRYLGSTSSTTNKKIRIVMNYLTGTGFRTGRITHSCITKIRTQLSAEIKKRKAKKTWE